MVVGTHKPRQRFFVDDNRITIIVVMEARVCTFKTDITWLHAALILGNGKLIWIVPT